MTIPELQAFYKTRKQEFTTALDAVNDKIQLFSNARLVTAAGFALCFYFLFSTNLMIYPVILFAATFAVLVAKHSKLFREKTHLENLIKINTNELQSLSNDFSCFKNGTEYIDPKHPYSHDLDIFGGGSLFQYMNRSGTLEGEAALATSLANPLMAREQILERQQGVLELSQRVDFRQHFLATSMTLEEFRSDRHQLLEWANHKPFLYRNGYYSILLWALPIVTVGFILASLVFDSLSGIAVLSAVIQWVTLSMNLKKVNAFHQYISRKKNILQKYSSLLFLIRREDFKSSLLKKFHDAAAYGDERVKSLASLVRSLDARLNFLTNLIVNSILLYDLQCVYRLERWKEENAQNLETWLNVIRDLDMLNSIATMAFNNQDFTFPEITQEQKIKATALAHPLISSQERVANDVSIGDPQFILVVTGANMAGKSTFLRTLGVNIVLALSGAPVCAKKFQCAIINLRSGMRTADSLQDHQSYFYAELNRLKSIVDELRSGKSLFVLLDEILKGTNSTDKQAGSVALVKQLREYSCLAIIATHDLALGDLEREYPQQVKDYCFEPNIENDQLSFDYILKPGIAQKMNATFLMKKMGIIPAG